MLPWIGRYSSWLEDRARLNRFRFSWLFVWQRKWESEAAKRAKQAELSANPPPSGSWFLLDPDENLEMPAPNLECGDAEKDGLALKKMIAIGAGVPTHYLAEPESSTRTTAEAAGTPTFRGLEQTQQFFLEILSEIASDSSRAPQALRPPRQPSQHHRGRRARYYRARQLHARAGSLAVSIPPSPRCSTGTASTRQSYFGSCTAWPGKSSRRDHPHHEETPA